MPQINKLQKKKRKTENSEKRKERSKYYNLKKWKDIRTAYLINNPLCTYCLAEGIITPAEDIHHKISFMSGKNEIEKMQLFFDSNNLVALCKVCHGNIHSFQQNNK